MATLTDAVSTLTIGESRDYRRSSDTTGQWVGATAKLFMLPDGTVHRRYDLSVDASPDYEAWLDADDWIEKT